MRPLLVILLLSAPSRADDWHPYLFAVGTPRSDRVQIDGAFILGDDGLVFNRVRVDVRVQLFRWRQLIISAGAGYQSDDRLERAVTGVIVAGAVLGRLDLSLAVRGAHYFQPGRDPLDLFVTADALIRANRWLRVGAEYVGEELEADDSDGAVGGRHYFGPTAALQLRRVRLSVTGGAVVTQAQAGPLARASFA
jgi:hypothetical protein